MWVSIGDRLMRRPMRTSRIRTKKLWSKRVCGAKIVIIEGNFDDALPMIRELSVRGHFSLVNSINPDRIVGPPAICPPKIGQLRSRGFENPNVILRRGGTEPAGAVRRRQEARTGELAAASESIEPAQKAKAPLTTKPERDFKAGAGINPRPTP